MTSTPPAGGPEHDRSYDRDAEPGSAGAPGRRGGWFFALLAVPVLCCAGPGLLAALGAGSVSAGLALTAGSVLAALGAGVVTAVGVAILVRRRHRPPDR